MHQHTRDDMAWAVRHPLPRVRHVYKRTVRKAHRWRRLRGRGTPNLPIRQERRHGNGGGTGISTSTKAPPRATYTGRNNPRAVSCHRAHSLGGDRPMGANRRNEAGCTEYTRPRLGHEFPGLVAGVGGGPEHYGGVAPWVAPGAVAALLRGGEHAVELAIRLVQILLSRKRGREVSKFDR